MADEATPSDWYRTANDMIRSAAKWVVAAGAGVGAALIAGSQLSSIGKLDVCAPTTLECARLPLSFLGAMVALVAVIYIVWRSVRILMPVVVPIDELAREWGNCPVRADVAFFKANPSVLGEDSPAALLAARDAAWQEWEKAEAALAATPNSVKVKEQVAQTKAAYASLDDSILTVTSLAQHLVLTSMFGRLMRDVLAATVVSALAIVTFAWAANPPTPPPPSATLRGVDLAGADLRDADLSGADLREADFTNANLSGATLKDTKVKDAIWNGTTCPDGTKSADHDDTCVGHLSP